jgi:hypothetical protein
MIAGTWRDQSNPDFCNVIRVRHFHQAPQRIQYLNHQPANVIVLPIMGEKRRRHQEMSKPEDATAPPR